MARTHDYRELAAWCQKRVHGLLDLARDVDPIHKHTLLDMAVDWWRCADEADAKAEVQERHRSRRV